VGSLAGISDAFVAKLAGPAPPTIEELMEDVRSLGLESGLERSMLSKLEQAQASLANERPNACNLLEAFGNEIAALSGTRIDPAGADGLQSKADVVQIEVGCT
jgi:hypothetical protein